MAALKAVTMVERWVGVTVEKLAVHLVVLKVFWMAGYLVVQWAALRVERTVA